MSTHGRKSDVSIPGWVERAGGRIPGQVRGGVLFPGPGPSTMNSYTNCLSFLPPFREVNYETGNLTIKVVPSLSVFMYPWWWPLKT